MPYRAVMGLFRALAVLAWALLPYHRRVAAVQMRAALGVTTPCRHTLRVFLNQAEILVDTVRYAYMDDTAIRRKVRVDGVEHLRRARAKGKGIMMITGHIGNWEILSHIPRILGIDFCVMADRRNDERLEAMVDGIRSRSGATILPPTGKALALVRELRKGRTIGMVVDGRHDGPDAHMCDVLGMAAPTNPAPAFIALKGDAVVLPVAAFRERGGYRIVFSDPVVSRDFGSDRQAAHRLSAWMQSWVSETVRQHPTEWFWLYSRWTTRPEMRRIIRRHGDLRAHVRTRYPGGASPPEES